MVLTSRYFELADPIMNAKLTRILLSSKKMELMSSPNAAKMMKPAITEKIELMIRSSK